MKSYVLWSIFVFLGVLNLQITISLGQKNTLKIKKIVVQSQTIDPETETKGELTSKSYEVFYANNQIDYMMVKNLQSKANPNLPAKWDFIRYKDSTLIRVNDAVIFRYFYNTQGQLERTTETKTMLSFRYQYDEKGRVASVFYTNEPNPSKSEVSQRQFNYENSQKMTFEHKDSFTSITDTTAMKGVVTFDDKINPFYQNFELWILIQGGVFHHFTPNNILTQFNTFMNMSSQITCLYKYNRKNYPVSCEQMFYIPANNKVEKKLWFEYKTD